jgi:thiol-disulfide isomerase/thioredoxin
VADFKGSKAMLLFWNPGCGFCRKMTDELKQWEANPPKDSPKLLIVSTGTVEANQAMGLSSTTVLDEGFQTGRAFGASGTPSAILIDASGKIASEVAVGGPNVMALATGKQPAPQEAQPQAPASKKGQAAPEVKLKDIDGAEDDVALLESRMRILQANDRRLEELAVGQTKIGAGRCARDHWHGRSQPGTEHPRNVAYG